MIHVQNGWVTIHYTVCRDSEGVLVAAIPIYPGCATQATTEEDLAARIQDAAKLYLEHLKEKGLKAPTFVGLREMNIE
jgi:predicted RNase H-like HicB family nuclease